VFSARLWKTIAGKVVYGATCLIAAVTLAASFYAHKVVTLVSETEQGIAITGPGSPGSSASIGAMNILVMGLESRTNYQGQELPADLLAAMHAGSVGGQDTNTLILIHIFAGGQKAEGISIPRDDLVNYPQQFYPGVTNGKIDQAYDFAYAESLNQTADSSMSSAERYLKANQAGQAATVETVESVTGVHVDHFVEVNLAGFYSLAQVFGGIEVCVKPWNDGENFYDANSGWNAVKDGYNLKKGGDQYLHLAADQALAYVRDRDSLPQVDLDRTHRQQAVLDYVTWALKNENYFSDVAKLTALLDTASQYLITDSTFNLLDFATDMHAMSGSNITFQTLPISGQVNDYPLNGTLQDVNTIDVPYVQGYVKNLFYPPAAAQQGTASTQSTGSRLIGAQASPSPSSSPAPTPGNDGQTGGAVTVAPNAKYGVPCVY
jgi:LCP family protein required for cell wall assembly